MTATIAQISRLLEKARARHGEISFPGVCRSWEEALTVEGPHMMLWYNGPTGSTHVVTEEV